MDLQQSIINDRVESLADQMNENRDDAFLRFAFSTLFSVDYDDLQPEDIVDGGADKGLDVISIEEDTSDGTAQIYVIQSKHTKGFSSNALTLLANGLTWLFDEPRSEFSKLPNSNFVNKISEFRELRNRLGPSNLSIDIYFVTIGNEEQISNEYSSEIQKITKRYDNNTFDRFKIHSIGSNKLVELINIQEKKSKQINYDIPIIYDRNKPSYIEYQNSGIKGCICSVKAKDLAKMVSETNEETIFDLNLRRFYGIDKGKVNPSIAHTASDETEAHMFWFYNNGVTIVCDDYDVVNDPDTNHLKLKNLQIVNGCQTSMTISSLMREDRLRAEAEIIVKVFKTKNSEFLDRVVLTTNNQNSISSRDLKSNDPVQVNYQRAFREGYGYRYERKPREFGNLPRNESKKVISNEKVAQSYLAIVKKKPTTARTQKYKTWDSPLYETIFSNQKINKHLLSYLIYNFCLKSKRETLKAHREDPITYGIVSYGIYHIARITAHKFSGTDDWSEDNRVNDWIKGIERDENQLKAHYEAAIEMLKSILSSHKIIKTETINNVFKATQIEALINRHLYNPSSSYTDEEELPLIY